MRAELMRQVSLANRGIEGSGSTYAYYNDPMTPGFMRRNEVLVEISP